MNQQFMKTLNRSAIAIATCIILSAVPSCKKDNDDNKTSDFSWNYDGNQYTSRIDTAYFSSLPFSPVIMATTDNNLFPPSAELQINLSSFNVASYSFPGGNNAVQYIDPLGFSYNDVNGTLTITSNSGSRLSGNFSVMLNSGKAISGNFSNVPVKP
jgi:hypothetical protein